MLKKLDVLILIHVGTTFLRKFENFYLDNFSLKLRYMWDTLKYITFDFTYGDLRF